MALLTDLPSFEERVVYVRRLLDAVGADYNDALVKRLVRIWVRDGFSHMVRGVQAERPKGAQ